jgi:acyl carrier protein
MPPTRETLIADLRAILGRLAAVLGHDSSGLADTDIIPDSDVVDSAGLIEFVIEVDETYQLGIEAEDMTVDQLGTLESFADFILARRARDAARPE